MLLFHVPVGEDFAAVEVFKFDAHDLRGNKNLVGIEHIAAAVLLGEMACRTWHLLSHESAQPLLRLGIE